MPTSCIVVAERISQTTEAHAAPATDRQTDHRWNRSQLSVSAGTVNRIRNSISRLIGGGRGNTVKLPLERHLDRRGSENENKG